MRSRPCQLLVAAAVVMMVAAGCQAKVYGALGAKTPEPRMTLVTPLATAMVPRAPVAEPRTALPGLDDRIRYATRQAAAEGATISVAILDRATNQMFSNGDTQTLAIASVAKLFIADDLLLRESRNKTTLSPDDRQALDVMLRSSDDGAAEKFWNLDGGDQIITRVAGRYGLRSTTPGSDGRWWNTISTAPDLVRYYDMLLDGSGGLPPEWAGVIVGALARSTPNGVDGYPQRFGIPDGLAAEPVAVKQGWMCCVGANWMHLSTGVVGSDRRYIMVIGSLQPGDDATARATVTQAVKTIFPKGRI